MKGHLKVESVQEEGALALQALSLAKEKKSQIVQLGGVEVLLNAMARYPSASQLQESGCYALHNLVAANSVVRSKILELGGLDVAQRAERTSRDAARVLL